MPRRSTSSRHRRVANAAVRVATSNGPVRAVAAPAASTTVGSPSTAPTVSRAAPGHPSKDEFAQLPVPVIWRSTIAQIVQRLAAEDYHLENAVPQVSAVPAPTAKQIRSYIHEYGAPLAPLDPSTWDSSVAAWSGRHWEVLVDLWTTEGASDMVLRLIFHEDADRYRFEIQLVYVP